MAPGTTFKPGTYTFVVTNQGPSSHNLTINGPGVSDSATPTFAPGTKTLTVTLQNGTYDLFCSVPGHKALGMNTHITVGASSAAVAPGADVDSGWRRRQQQRRRLELSRTLTPGCGGRADAGE